MFEKVEYVPRTDEDVLQILVRNARICLKDSIEKFEYPAVLCKRNAKSAWEESKSDIDRLNKVILSNLTGRGGVYAIHVAKPGKDWHLKYVGQAKGSVIRQRIRSHLVWRNKNTESGKFTGSKFDEVQSFVCRGDDVGISFVEIIPETLRHYVETTILKKSQPEWNHHETTLQRQKRSKTHCSV